MDFHLVKNGNKLEVKYVLDRPGYKSGVFAKYGTENLAQIKKATVSGDFSST